MTGTDVRQAATSLLDQLAKALDSRFGNGQPPPAVEEARPELAGIFMPWEDLTERAGTAPLVETFPFDGVAQYEKLFEAIARVLHRRRAHHVLLTGERDVGKSMVIAELARRAALGRIPFLKERRFINVDCRYVPADESRERLFALLAEVQHRPELIVCLEGCRSLLAGDRLFGNRALLLSILAHARCQLIGLLTPRDYEECFAEDPDSAEFFSRVDVEEPNLEVSLKILHHLARGLEQHFAVAIDAQAVRQAVVLSANYILNQQLPAKAVRILHRVCEDIDYERAGSSGQPAPVSAEQVIQVVAQMSGVPQETLRGIAERSDYEQSLGDLIFGQDHAVHEVATELGLIKAGMTDPTKPASVMLFIGQTGTGKTEMAKALARFYSTSKRLKTYTLGNCVEPHSVSTIIGVPPGYVGNDQGGRLINELNADPYCVFLLDEADKAHPDVLQPFLNLFDEGWVADQRGVRAYGHKSIFILTTNVGQRMIADLVQQGKSQEEIATRMKEALAQIRHSKSDRPVFTPEFLARIKRIIVFKPLDHAALRGICQKRIHHLQQAWTAQRGKTLKVPDCLGEFVADQAHALNEKSKGREGGRIVGKLISEWIEAKLQRAITLHAQDYKECHTVVLEFTPPQDSLPEGTSPEIGVTFEKTSDTVSGDEKTEPSP